MKKKCLKNNECPMARAYDAIGDWWSLLVVMQILIQGKRRFCEIQEDLGMARNILSARLTKLVEEGIIEKVPAADGSAYHEYAPTAKGRDLHPVLVAIWQWGEKYSFDDGHATHVLADSRDHHAIPRLVVRAADGRTLSPEELTALPIDEVVVTKK